MLLSSLSTKKLCENLIWENAFFHFLKLKTDGNYYLVFQKCFSTALRKRLSCTDSRASISRYTCHMSMMFSFSERTSITLSPTARVWILNKFPHIFFGREKKFCQIFRVVKNDVKYVLKFDKKKTLFHPFDDL